MQHRRWEKLLVRADGQQSKSRNWKQLKKSGSRLISKWMHWTTEFLGTRACVDVHMSNVCTNNQFRIINIDVWTSDNVYTLYFNCCCCSTLRQGCGSCKRAHCDRIYVRFGVFWGNSRANDSQLILLCDKKHTKRDAFHPKISEYSCVFLLPRAHIRQSNMKIIPNSGTDVQFDYFQLFLRKNFEHFSSSNKFLTRLSLIRAANKNLSEYNFGRYDLWISAYIFIFVSYFFQRSNKNNGNGTKS